MQLESFLTTARLVELVKTLVAIPSPTGEEQAMADWVAAFLSELGLEQVTRLPVEEAGDSVFGWLNPKGSGPTLMLNFHLDTFEAFADWETNPFEAVEKHGNLFGLGTHDMKGGAACVLAAVEAIVRSGVGLGNGRLLVSATSDEENWSRGAHALINSGALANVDYCLVPEPSAAGTLTVGQRGRHVFHLAFRGKSVHAAFGGGINAVVDAARVVAILEDSNKADVGISQEWGMPGSRSVIGLHGGGTLILVPETADLYSDRHIMPGETVEQAAAQIEAAIEKANIQSEVTLTWDERPTPAPGPVVVPSDSKLVTTVLDILAEEQKRPILLTLGRSVADTSHFAVHGGVPTLICGPQGGNTCAANEYVAIDSLLPTARTYVRAAMALVAG